MQRDLDGVSNLLGVSNPQEYGRKWGLYPEMQLVQANVPNLPPFPNTQYIDSSTLEGINSIRILLENWLHAVNAPPLCNV